MTASSYRGPAGSITVVDLDGATSPAGVDEATELLRTRPRVGGLVITGVDGQPVALVVHAVLLQWTPRRTGETAGAWLHRLAADLAFKEYELLTAEGRPYVDRNAPVSVLRLAVRRGRAVIRQPTRLRIERLRDRRRRAAFVRRLRFRAWLAGAQLELDIAPDLVVEPGIRLQIRRGRSLLRIGPRCSIASGGILRLGGELVIGPKVEVRHDVTLNVKGRLELQGRNVLGRGTMVHADALMVWEWGATTAEYVTVLDSHHDFDGSLVHVHDQGVQAFPVTVGAASLLGARSTVMPGVRVGRCCLLGTASLATKDIPDGWIAIGSPAEPVRRAGAEGGAAR